VVLFWLFNCLVDPGNGLFIDPPTGEHPVVDTIPCNVKPDTTFRGGVSPRTRLIDIARSQIGVRQTGDNTGPEVDMYLRSVGVEPPAFWCAAFVGWIHLQAGLEIPRGAAWSPSWFPQKRVIDNEKAQAGDVGGIYFRSLGRIAHVFVFDQDYPESSNFITTIEGNTNDDGSRNGHSVLRKKRSKNTIHKVSSWI
jgi:hypothetical protein